MKKAFFISLLLVGAFIICSSEKALAQCIGQDYVCTYTTYHYGEAYDSGTTCVDLCFDYYFNYYRLNSGKFSCILYPATGSKNLLGTCDTYSIGCSVESRGRSIIANITYIEEGLGYVEILKCTPCDSCCG